MLYDLIIYRDVSVVTSSISRICRLIFSNMLREIEVCKCVSRGKMYCVIRIITSSSLIKMFIGWSDVLCRSGSWKEFSEIRSILFVAPWHRASCKILMLLYKLLWNTSSTVGSSPSHVSQDKHKNKYKVDKGQYRWSFSLLSEYRCITIGVILWYIYSELSLEFW
jgi:hypothetical protein